MTELRAGAARADMTPPPGIPLAGFWAPRPAEGIDTPLTAHALVLDDGATRLAFVAVDLIALLARDADQAKARIHDRAAVRAENVLISCSHTHEAPYPCPLLGKDTRAEPEYMAKVIGAIVEAVALAAEALSPAEVGFASTAVPGLCQNRRRLLGPGDAFNVWSLPAAQPDTAPPAGPVDDELLALAVRRRTGEPLALLWSFSLHAHAFAGPRVSADYPYYVWRQLAERIGGDPTCVFLPGACGDINCASEAEPQRVVDGLSDALAGLYAGATFSPRAALASRLERMEVPLRDFSAFQEDEIRRKQPAALAVCRQEWEILRRLDERSVETTVHAMAVGGFAVAGVPGELFCALGLDIKRRSPFAATAVAELSDDYVGYLPTDAAYDQGGYELFNVRSSKAARGTGERMADELVRLLGELYPADAKEQSR